MIFNLGSTNPTKLAATQETVNAYFPGATVLGKSVSSGVSDQPLSEEETFQGAMNRAKAAFVDCQYSIGLETGLRKSPLAKSGYFDFCACVIYDGNQFYPGTSSQFEYPTHIIHMLLEEGLDVNQALFKAGLTTNPQVGSAEGALGVLTKGRTNRAAYTSQALHASLLQILNKELY